MGTPFGARCGMMFLLMALGCTESNTPAGQPKKEKEKIPEVRTTREFAVTGKGATVELKLDQVLQSKIRAALDKDSKQTIRLSILGIVPPSDDEAVIGISAFLNKADATISTPADDPHYVGSVIFQPDKPPAAQNFLLELRDTLGQLQDRDELSLDKPLKITIVPFLSDGQKSPPAGLSLPVKEVVLSLPPPKR